MPKIHPLHASCPLAVQLCIVCDTDCLQTDSAAPSITRTDRVRGLTSHGLGWRPLVQRVLADRRASPVQLWGHHCSCGATPDAKPADGRCSATDGRHLRGARLVVAGGVAPGARALCPLRASLFAEAQPENLQPGVVEERLRGRGQKCSDWPSSGALVD